MAEGLCLGIHCRKDVVGFVVLKNPVKVTEESEQRTYVFSFRVSKRSAYKCKIAAENKSVAVQYIDSFFVVVFSHRGILA